jgi:hypothetical protein
MASWYLREKQRKLESFLEVVWVDLSNYGFVSGETANSELPVVSDGCGFWVPGSRQKYLNGNGAKRAHRPGLDLFTLSH